MKPINAKASTQDGLNPSCIILDESHAQNVRAARRGEERAGRARESAAALSDDGRL